MPDRLIRESWCASETIDRLTPFEETVFARMIVNCDDFGRMDGRSSVVCSRLFVTRRSIREKTVMAAVRRLEEEGLILCYEVEGRPYIQMQGWGKHQRIRNQRSKFPAPPDPEQAKKGEVTAYELPPREQTAAADCGQLPSIAANGGLYPIQSNPNPDSDTNPDPKPDLNPKENLSLQSNPTESNPIQPNGELPELHSEQQIGRARENFQAFWRAYPKKVNKQWAWEAYLQSGAAQLDQQMLLNALRDQKKSENWRKEAGRYIPKPADWLLDGRWEELVLPPYQGYHPSDIDSRTYTGSQISQMIPDPTACYEEKEEML